MNELMRAAYLEALGLDAYVSRHQLPGAAATSRLAIARRVPAATGAPTTPLEDMQGRLDTGRRGRSKAGDTLESDSARSAAPAPEAAPVDTNLPRFSLSAIMAGNWLWLEELGDMPLAVEQVRLVEAMALALSCALGDDSVPAASKPDIMAFDWPIHTNRQLELGEEAARSAVAGFVGRRLEQFKCAGLVVLGRACAGRVPVGEIGVRVVHTHSSQEILASPDIKQQVWRDLLPLVKLA